MAPKSLEESCIIYADIWSQKNYKTPEQVSLYSHKKIWFNCLDCGHDYEQSPNKKSIGRGCHFCSNFSRCGACLSCLAKSCNIYSDIWSPKNDIDPIYVALNDNKKYWFTCKECNHDYQQSPGKKSGGRGCPYCAKYTGTLCGSKSCLSCLSKSCNIHSGIWSNTKNNGVEPHTVPISSNTKYWFNCYICSHDYYQSPNSKSQGSSCPYCANIIRCGNCLFCLPKSCYVYKDIWSQKNYKTPEQVSLYSNEKIWFNCLYCEHDYEQSPSKKSIGRGCPYCKNKTERRVADYLKEIDVKFIKEFKINSKKRYDFFIPEFNLIIEVDGEQHFKQVSIWKSCEHNLENDIQKMKVALENGYSILRIYQPDVYYDTIDWKKYINDNLSLRKTPDINYRSSDPDIYKNHNMGSV